jgi:hypothetical protein
MLLTGTSCPLLLFTCIPFHTHGVLLSPWDLGRCEWDDFPKMEQASLLGYIARQGYKISIREKLCLSPWMYWMALAGFEPN